MTLIDKNYLFAFFLFFICYLHLRIALEINLTSIFESYNNLSNVSLHLKKDDSHFLDKTFTFHDNFTFNGENSIVKLFSLSNNKNMFIFRNSSRVVFISIDFVSGHTPKHDFVQQSSHR